MITGQLRSKIDKLWEEFWTGGVTNPLTVIEQISFLMFARLLDMRESTEEKKWSRKNPKKKFPGVYYSPATKHLRWSQLKQEADADKVLKIVRDEVFPHFRVLGQQNGTSKNSSHNTFDQYMKDATLMINKPSLLMSAINMIDALPLTQGDTKGDLYEYLLSKLTTAGINGQFRTPRHIIRLMVDLVLQGNEEEAMSWTVGDPACGTGGFLVEFMEALREHNTSPKGILVDEETGDKTYTADLIEPRQWKHIKSEMFHGFDFDVTMLRIAAMNMMLHDIDTPDINYQDTLSTNFTERTETKRWASDAFDLILANPPFKGSLDEDDVHKTLTGKVKTKKTELLFLVLILRMLKLGGRCAVVVPDGISFGRSRAHKKLRKLLVDENQLEAIIKLPGGVFRPYANVSTAILLFTKGGETNDVFFFDVEADGMTLDDKRNKVGDPNDWQDLDLLRTVWPSWLDESKKAALNDRSKKAFFVPKSEIVENEYDLAISVYRKLIYVPPTQDSPMRLWEQLHEVESKITDDSLKLKGLLAK